MEFKHYVINIMPQLHLIWSRNTKTTVEDLTLAKV